MTRRLFVIVPVCALVLGLVFSGARALGEDKGGKAGKAAVPMCPVMDEAADFTVSTATDDGPVFFCCAGCIKKYTKEPEKYSDKVAAQRKVLADRPKVQVTCPLSGKPVSSKISIDHNGQKVYFCDEGCSGKFKENPAQYAAKLANSYSYQTICPVMKEEIDPAVFADLSTGQRVYLCCKKCQKKFGETPLKYKDHLAEQGIHLDEEKLKMGGNG